MTRERLPRPLKLTMLAVIATLIGLAAVEVVLRLLPATRPLGRLSYETLDGSWVGEDPTEAARRGVVTMMPPDQTPRPRGMFAPGASFYLRYSDPEVLGCDWMDPEGRVRVDINQDGLREREIPLQKAPGERRIVCLGDSFTFGWGIPVELGWVRLLENELREDGKNVRTVNCGAAGAILVDEYQWALERRFAKFEPDAVIVTIFLNDLIPCSGLFVHGPAPDTGSELLDRILAALGHTPLELDPAIDWVDLLLGFDRAEGEKLKIYTPDNPWDALWAQGTPQRALAAMKRWCDERNIILLVSLWPFLQGLGPSRSYPFEKLHRLVAAECDRLAIPFHDVLPALRATPAERLWVTPADMHANPTAQRLALPGLVEFARRRAGL